MNRVNPEHAPSSDAFSAALALASAGKAKARAAALAAHFDPARRDAWVSDVWQELHRRAAVGEPLNAEEFVRVLMDRPDCDDLAVDVLYAEYAIRSERGEDVSGEEYVRKHPRYARLLARQFSIESGLIGLKLNDDDTLLESRDAKISPGEAPSASAPATTNAVRQIGRYIVVEELAATPKSRVYRVVHPELSRECVLKLGAGAALTDEQRSRVAREGKMLAAIDHPNVAKVIDADFLDGRPYIVCEYVRGRPLSQVIRESRLTLKERVTLVAKVARALAAVHREGLLHLDVKPANVIVRDSGEPCLIDFDLAATRDDLGAAEIETGSLRGTLQFMSPEQASGRSDGVDQRADVFSLGAVLYFVLTGEPPYEQTSFVELLGTVRQGEWRRGLLESKAAPARLSKICRRAMAIDARQRYAQVDDFADDLEGYLSASWRPAKLLAAALVSAAVLFGLYAFATQQPTGVGVQRLPAELSVEVWQGDRFVDLEDVVPLPTGTPISIQVRRPAGAALLLASIDAHGVLRELLRDDAFGESGLVSFPRDPGEAAPLVGSPGVEIVLLVGSRRGPVSFAELQALCLPAAAWPAGPEDAIAVANSEGVVFHGQSRGLGDPVAVTGPESLLATRLKALVAALQPRYDVVEVVAFTHSPGEGD